MHTLADKGRAGTISYMSPELLSGCSAPTRESDVFAFGVVMWETLRRERAFRSVNRMENWFAQLEPLCSNASDESGILTHLAG